MGEAGAKRLVRVELATCVAGALRPSPNPLPMGEGSIDVDMRKTVAVDAAFLKALIDPQSRSSSVLLLIQHLSAENAKIIIPTPALAEFLKLNPQSHTTLDTINRSACFQVRPFDDKASVELAELLDGQVGGIRDILPFDRQIVAIAKGYGASIIYADDEKVADYAAQCGIPAKRLKDLD